MKILVYIEEERDKFRFEQLCEELLRRVREMVAVHPSPVGLDYDGEQFTVTHSGDVTILQDQPRKKKKESA